LQIVGKLTSASGLAITGGVGLALSYPPFSCAPLAWLAPVCWALLIRRRDLCGTVAGQASPASTSPKRLSFARHPYVAIWFGGWIFWLVTLHWLLLPGWVWTFGWLGLATYLSLYVPLFVAIARCGVHACGLPLVLVVPVVWTAMELAQAHMLTGFAMCGLAQTQYGWVHLIQIGDVAGPYGIAFVMTFTAACLARMLPCYGQRFVWRPAIAAASVLGLCLGYGAWRLAAQSDSQAGDSQTTDSQTTAVALVQPSLGRDMQNTPGWRRIIHQSCAEQSRAALRQWPDVELIVWPETTLDAHLITFDEEPRLPAKISAVSYETREDLDLARKRDEARLRRTALELGAAAGDGDRPQRWLLAGLYTWHVGRDGTELMNSAALVNSQGSIVDRYDKVHAVVFAEYVPWGSVLPWLNALFALDDGITRGSKAQTFDAGRLRVSPSICYEITLPHRIRENVAALSAEEKEPDALVVLSNNGWFWGSAEQDLILANSVLRAVENRKPVLIAANTGISASISGDGRVVERTPKGVETAIRADVAPDARRSLYVTVGDWPAAVCLIAALAIVAARLGFVGKRPPKH